MAVKWTRKPANDNPKRPGWFARPLRSQEHYLLLGLVHNFVVGLDDVFLLLAGLSRAVAGGSGTGFGLGTLGPLIHRRAGGRIRLGQLFQRLLNLGGGAGPQRLLPGVDRGVQPVAIGRVQPVRPLLAVLLDVVGERVQPVPALDFLAPILVLAGMFFRGL